MKAEADVIQARLIACIEQGFTNVEVELDAEQLKEILDIVTIENIKGMHVGGTILDIHILASHLESANFIFTLKACNKAAHPVVAFIVKEQGGFQCDDLESTWIFNLLVANVNVSVRILIINEFSLIFLEQTYELIFLFKNIIKNGALITESH